MAVYLLWWFGRWCGREAPRSGANPPSLPKKWFGFGLAGTNRGAYIKLNWEGRLRLAEVDHGVTYVRGLADEERKGPYHVRVKTGEK